MTVKKCDLRQLLEKKQSEVLSVNRTSEHEAELEYLLDFWNTVDPDEKLLKQRWFAAQSKITATDELLDLLDKNSLSIWHFHRKSTTSYGDFREDFLLQQLNKRDIAGFNTIEDRYSDERRAIKEQYAAVNANLDRMTAKKGYLYLQELGFDVESILEEVPEYLPAIPVDRNLLGTGGKK